MPKFVPRQRKQKSRQKEGKAPSVDTNVAQIQPVSKSEREARKQELREEVRAQHAKVSGKKQKRLDKYIVREKKKGILLEYAIGFLSSDFFCRKTNSKRRRISSCSKS